MLDKSVIAAIVGAVALMVLVTFLGQGSRNETGTMPPTAPSPVSSSPQPPLSDVALFKKYDAMPPSARFPALLKDEHAKSVYLNQIALRVKGNFSQLSDEDKAFADSLTRGHGREAIETAHRSAQERAARAAKGSQ